MNDDDDHLFSLSRLGWRDKVALAFNYNPRRKVKTDETGRTLIIIEKADFYFILFFFIWRAMRTTTDLGGCVILYTTRHRASMIRRWVRRRSLQLPFRQFRVPHSIDTHIIKIKKSPASQTFSIADSQSSWLFLCVSSTEQQHDWPDDEAAAVNDVIYDQVVVPVWYRFWAAANRMRSPSGSHILHQGISKKVKKRRNIFQSPTRMISSRINVIIIIYNITLNGFDCMTAAVTEILNTKEWKREREWVTQTVEEPNSDNRQKTRERIENNWKPIWNCLVFSFSLCVCVTRRDLISLWFF